MATEKNTRTLQQRIEDFQSERTIMPAPMKEVLTQGSQDLIASGMTHEMVSPSRAEEFCNE